MHDFDTWNWRDLTFKAVAERAGVGERTVYRHFPTERHLHDAVMQRLESEAGISYEDVDLTNIGEVTGRVFASLQRFSVHESVEVPRTRRSSASMSAGARPSCVRCRRRRPDWSAAEQRVTAGLLDVLWNVPSYERLVGAWDIDGADATRAIGWLMGKVVAAIEDDDPPPA